jgi:hypothetical protein
VYASAAVADPKGVGPTVYVGSYDQNFYAFDARSGAIRWKHAAGGRISGSATVIGDVVYYANLATKTTVGLNDATGKQVFFFKDGAFTPVIADYHAIYLIGYGEIYQMLPPAPKRKHVPPPVHKPSKHKPKAKPKHHATPKHKAKVKKAKAQHKTQPKHHATPKQKAKAKQAKAKANAKQAKAKTKRAAAKHKQQAKSQAKHASKGDSNSSSKDGKR